MDGKFLPQGAETSAGGVHYRLWAPVCRHVDLLTYDANGGIDRELRMTRTEGGYFHTFDEGAAAGALYKFRLDQGPAFPDPASRWQPQGVHGPSMAIDPETYEWSDGNWRRPAFRDLVIYELHVGTFTPGGTFRSAIEKLGHVRDLGANAIEIMPVAEFDGERNWGYDGVCWYAPARCYGHPDDLRALVDAAHGLGLAVILDVVYNHFGPAGNYLAAYIGQYLDESAKTPWGGAIRYGDPLFKPLRDLVLANPGYWMREFHIDGFRLDATHAIVDESPQHLLANLTAVIHEAGGYAIAEDPRNEARLLEPAGSGMGFDGVWADDFHHTVRVANTREHESYLGDFAGTLEEAVDTIRNGWHYRGQVSSHGGKARGTETSQLAPEKFVHCISNHDQTGNHPFGSRLSRLVSPEAYRACSALLCLAPCTPLLFMGQEWAATTPFQFFTDHEAELGRLITEGRREEFKAFTAFRDPAVRAHIPDPQAVETFTRSRLQWEELEEPQSAATLALYRACLRLRHKEEAFRPATRENWEIEALPSGVGALRSHSGGGDWLVLFDLVGGHRQSLHEDAFSRQESGAWEMVLATGEPRFGGSASGWDAAAQEVRFAVPEVVVLRGQPTKTALRADN